MVRLAAMSKIKLHLNAWQLIIVGLNWNDSKKEKKEKEKQLRVEYKRAFKSFTHRRGLVMWQGHFLNFLFQLKIVIYYI